jgi:hypothetical protein
VAQREARRAAQHRYRRTEGGKRAHRWAEKRRRLGLTKKTGAIVDDEGSTLTCGCTTVPTSLGGSEGERGDGKAPIAMGRCHFCGAQGIVVDRFPRRGYGKQQYSVAGG